MTSSNEWWRGGVIYQIYPRSFMDSNGDGVGDLSGIVQKLDHIARLGVDAIWISPFCKSPMKDFGYDVSDYRDVDPVFGTLDDFKSVLNRAHELGLKIMMDQVWSHSSDQHDWFKESRQDKMNAKTDWYVWADPKPDGTPPNNWLSYFGGPAWTWDARRGQYYLHHFLSSQPSLNLWNPEVRQAIKNITAFWMDMGVDGFRLDVAHAYLYDPQLRDNPVRGEGDPVPTDIPLSNPMSFQRRIHSMDVPEILDWLSELRGFVNQWPDRCLMAEAGGDDSEAVAAAYARTGARFHQAYSFGIVATTMQHEAIKKAVMRVEELVEDGWISWTTNNHDNRRSVSRLPGENASNVDKALFGTALGLSLRGSYCLYQGEELGLPQAELSFDDLQDPYDKMLYPHHVGRDGCRTPMPWMGNAFNAGFSSAAKTWLPVPPIHCALAVDTQESDEHSVLNRIRAFIAWRREKEAMRLGDFALIETPAPVFAFTRTRGEVKVLCVFNCSDESAAFNGALSAYDMVQNNAVTLVENALTLAPYGFALFQKG